MTNVRMGQLTIDARDAAGLARFWAAALGWEVAPDASQYAARVDSPDRPPSSLPLLVLKVPESKSAKNRLHLDLSTDDLAGDVERLTGLGATVVHEKREWGVHWFTLNDPEGNEFCLGQPDTTEAAPA